MTYIIANSWKVPRYFDLNQGAYIDSVSEMLGCYSIAEASFAAHEANSAYPIDRPDIYTPVLDGLVPIPPRSRWSWDGSKFSLIPHCCRRKHATYETLKADADRLLRSIKRTPIAVESSGGLDCSIVIGMLRRSNLDPLLIAVHYERYEYRTERLIQLEVARGTQKAFLEIDGSTCLPFSRLSEIPKHMTPSDHSIFYAFSKVIVDLCRVEGIRLLISGDGFDELLGLELDQAAEEIPIDFYPWMQVPPWANEYVFHPSGVSYAPGASSWRLIESLFLLRAGELSDNRKTWARSTFADLIPDRLCSYHYKASAQGIWTEGAQKATNDILRICERAYSVCPELEISPARVEKLIPSSTSTTLKNVAALITRVSFAVWLTSLTRND